MERSKMFNSQASDNRFDGENKGEGRIKDKTPHSSPVQQTRRMTVSFTITQGEEEVSQSQAKFALRHAELKL